MNDLERRAFERRCEEAVKGALDYAAKRLAMRTARLIRWSSDSRDAGPPGGPPLSETGALKRSLRVERAADVVRGNRRLAEARIVAAVPYAAHLELGT